MMKPARPNLKTVAELAGVSAMTVSRALNGNAVIAKSTRARILKICRELGYVAQPQVSAAMRFVRMRRSGNYNGNLGFLHSYPHPDYSKIGPTYSSILKGAISRASELGYGLDVVHTAGRTGAQLDRLIQNRGIRGIVVGMRPRSIGHLALDWSDLVGVAIGYSLRRPALDRITSDLSRGIQLVCHKLRKLGYRRIAYVSTREFEQRTVYLLFSGFVGWHQLDSPGELPLTYLSDHPDAAAFWKWFRRARVDCVISPPASPAWSYLHAAGVKIPQELGFASVDVEAAEGPVSGLFQRQGDFGAAAVDKAVGLLSTGSMGIPASPMVSLIEGVWKSGPTTRKRSGN